MIIARVRLSLLKKYWLLNLERAEVQTGQIFDRIFWGDELFGEYFESKF